MSQEAINSLLKVAASNWADDNDLQIAFENVVFTPPPTSWCRFNIIPGRVTSIDLTGLTRTFVGIAQFTLVLATGQGGAEASALAKSLDAAFPVDTYLIDPATGFQVFITEPVSLGTGIADPADYTVPVTFQYRADTP